MTRLRAVANGLRRLVECRRFINGCADADALCPISSVSRHESRTHLLDSPPGWLGPKLLSGFQAETSHYQRRITSSGARNRGSITPSMARDVRRAERTRRLTCVTTHVDSSTVSNGIHLDLRGLDGAADSLAVDRVVLATGFHAHRPGGDWLDDAVETHGLPVARCGYPQLSASLAWAPGLYASGPLSEANDARH